MAEGDVILKPTRMMQVIEKRIFEKEAEKKEKNNLRSHPFWDAGENPGKYVISKTWGKLSRQKLSTSIKLHWKSESQEMKNVHKKQ